MRVASYLPSGKGSPLVPTHLCIHEAPFQTTAVSGSYRSARFLNAERIYGCAPTEIIYRICLRYILGFSDKIHIERNNIRLCDTLEFAKNGTMEAEMKKLFAL